MEIKIALKAGQPLKNHDFVVIGDSISFGKADLFARISGIR
jgi:hypothetical protein